MILIDLKNKNIHGSTLEKVCDILGISINRNMIPNDVSPLFPSGVRMGTYAVTARGLKPKNMIEIAELVNDITKFCQKITRGENLSTEEFFRRLCDGNWLENPTCIDIKKRICKISQRFSLPNNFIDQKE